MKKLIAILICSMLLGGCAVSHKYVEFNMEENSCITVEGGIDPQFLRENTTEGQDPKSDLGFSLTDKILGK